MTQTELELPPEQLSLMPRSIPVPTERDIPLDQLPPNEQLLGPHPTAEDIFSIQRLGQLSRIIVIELPDGGFEVGDGSGRIKIMRLLQRTHIRASVYPFGTVMAEVIALSANQRRRQNPIRDLEQIMRLEGKGHPPKSIQEQLGISPQTYKKRAELQRLIPGLLEALGQGTVLIKHGEQAAKLPLSQQTLLAERLAKAGKLSDEDFYQVTRAARESFNDTLSEAASQQTEQLSLIEAPKALTTATSWEDAVVNHLLDILDLLPPEAEDYRITFRSIGKKLGADL